MKFLLKIFERKEVQLLLFLVIILVISLGVGTQHIVKLLNYHPALGKPLIFNIYNPFLIVKLSRYYNLGLKVVLDRGMAASSTVILLTLLPASLYLFKTKKLTSHGSARWITFSELKKAKLISRKYVDGVILGRIKRFGIFSYTIIENMATHILMIAPSRSGKGVGVLIPTLLNWKNSVVVFDIKGENYAITAGFRKKVLKQKVLKWAPDKLENSISINPLAEIRVGTPYEFLDTQIVMDIITDPGEGKERSHWDKSASTFLVGIALHILYIKKREGVIASFGDIIDFLTAADGTFDSRLIKLINYEHEDSSELFRKIYSPGQVSGVNEGTHPLVARTAAELINKDERERASIVSSALACLNLFKDPVIRKNTSTSDLKMWDLMNYKTSVSLYIVAEVKSLSTLAPLIRIVMTQMVGTLCPEMNFENDKPTHRHKLLLMLDEFPAIGKMQIIEKGLGYFAGYGIKTIIVAQSLGQITKLYGDKNGVTDNCVTSVFYSPVATDKDTPKLISDLLGDKTLRVSNFSSKVNSFFDGNYSENKQARKLLTPEEVRNKLGEERNIISITGMYPIWGYKIKYYQEKYFLNKTKNKYGIPKTDKIEY